MDVEIHPVPMFSFILFYLQCLPALARGRGVMTAPGLQQYAFTYTPCSAASIDFSTQSQMLPAPKSVTDF